MCQDSVDGLSGQDFRNLKCVESMLGCGFAKLSMDECQDFQTLEFIAGVACQC